MTETPEKPQSAVNRIAQGLRTMALSLQPGDHVGSEESLARRFKVTGPTLRQAVRLLEHEQLIEVRRGVRGGYFAARPNLDTISRVAAVYLRSRVGSFDEMTVFLEFIQPFLVDLVLASDRLEEVRPFAQPADGTETHEELTAQQTEFGDLLWSLADNAPMQLVYAIFFQVGSGVEREPVQDLSEVRMLQANRIRFARALLDRDRAVAIECAVVQCRAIHGGIKRNLIASQERAAAGLTR